MADSEARREARRRKILQNSESRMNRLLGKPDATVGAPAETNPTSADSPLPESRDFSTGSLTTTDSRPISPAAEEVTHTPAGVTMQTGPEEIQILAGNLRQRVFPRDRQSAGGQGVPQQSSTSAAAPRLPKPARNGTSDSHARTESSMGRVDSLKQLDLIRCGGCLLVAFLTHWALRFGLGLLFWEWVMIPFVLLEGSLLYYQTTYLKDVQLPHKSDMMTYALVFSGVRQDLILKYNMIMGYVSAATEDFALFLFTFIVCNAIIT